MVVKKITKNGFMPNSISTPARMSIMPQTVLNNSFLFSFLVVFIRLNFSLTLLKSQGN